MWKLNKPNLKRSKNKDIKELIAKTKLTGSIKTQLKTLYQEYDSQKGFVTDLQLSVISDKEADIIYAAYNNKSREGQDLAYIRSELVENVYKCPYCGLNQPNTLDHYMPEGKYKPLAMCRMNLVPMCGECNNYKGTKDYNKFIHCYYEQIPDVVFFIAKIKVRKKRFIVDFDFDSATLADKSLETKFNYQAKEIRLFKRLKKESIVFCTSLCKSCEASDTKSLKLWLQKRLSQYIDDYGKNDWRCAIIRGIISCPGLDIDIINSYKTSVRVNHGI